MALAYSQKRSMRAIVGVRMNEWMNKRIHEVPSTRIRIFLNPQLFLSRCGFRPHVSGESGTGSDFLNPLSRVEIFEYAMNPESCGLIKNFLPGDVTRWKSYKSYKLQILVWSKKLFRTYSSSRLIGAGRAVESVFIRLSLFKIKFAPLSLLMNKLE